jgi:RNA polymerase sigma-70 factor (ECF subfamily)
MSLHNKSASVEGDETKLVAEAKCGSMTAFEQLVERYEARIFRLAQTIAPSREDAEKIMQNAFVQAYRNLCQFHGDSQFCNWLVRITVNEGLVSVRRRPSGGELSEDSIETADSTLPRQLDDWGPNPEQRYSQQELQSILATTVDQLPPLYRTVLHLRDVEGFSTHETAQALDLSPSVVKTRLRCARLLLRESLNQYFRLTGPPRGEFSCVEMNRRRLNEDY